MNITPTAGDIFDLSIAIEKEMVAFYCRLRQLFGNLPVIRDFWGEMRDEEIEHIVQLRMLRDSLPSEKLSEEVDPAWVEKGVRILGEIQSSFEEPIANLNQAYELAHEWENGEINRIFLFLAEKYIGDKARMKIAEKMIDNHLERLMEFIPGYQTAADREAVRASG